jgi:high-affinity Fe2+/Pb2+ permease
MIKVNSLVVKIVGAILAVVGLALLLFGFVTWNKQVMATGFIACLIAVTLLYYGWRMKPAAKESGPTDAGAGLKQKI